MDITRSFARISLAHVMPSDCVASERRLSGCSDTFSFRDSHSNPNPNPNPNSLTGKQGVSFDSAVQNARVLLYIFVGWAIASLVFGLIFSQVPGALSTGTVVMIEGTTSSLSFVGASVMLGSRLFMTRAERRSFHLVFCSTTANLLSSVIQIGLNVDGTCELGGAVYQVLLMQVFWDTLLSVHVLLLFLYPVGYGRKHHPYQIYFHLVGWGCTALFGILPLFTRNYGINSGKQDLCWLTESSIMYFFVVPFGFCVITNIAIMAYMTTRIFSRTKVTSKEVRLSTLIWVMCLAFWSTFANVWFLPFDFGVPGTAWAVVLGEFLTGLNGFVHCLIWLPKILKTVRKHEQKRRSSLVRRLASLEGAIQLATPPPLQLVGPSLAQTPEAHTPTPQTVTSEIDDDELYPPKPVFRSTSLFVL